MKKYLITVTTTDDKEVTHTTKAKRKDVDSLMSVDLVNGLTLGSSRRKNGRLVFAPGTVKRVTIERVDLD